MGLFSNLQGKDWVALVPLVGTISFLIFVTARAFAPGCSDKKAACVNPDIKKNIEKVADTVDIEDIGEKAAFCRCWRSKKFPYCDGSHNQHNKNCCDNVGPLIIKKSS
ncbi:CDGSH iron-sulfur domain-containing protein 2 homolog isoform X2 [Lineus longissimus]|uniref:CDGSH iron-sulfur domain-containing protein 2 homolog isoform X2 n=1 Tax=Lineus longissimus TaxID=88925 RepID=UPI00315DBE09